MLMFDIIEGCNFKCYFCEARNVQQNIYMDLALFKHIILQAKEMGLKKIYIVPAKGEPFLHPDIYELLEFANNNMEQVNIRCNATAINVSELLKINRKNLKLGISYYGSTPEKFKELTCTTDSLFKAFHRKLEELTENNIEYNIGRRDIEWEFNYDGIEHRPSLISPKKCLQHHLPRISPLGKMTFCNFIPGIVNDHEMMNFADLNLVSLNEALSNPLRFKFFDSEGICRKYCVDVDETCHIDPPLQMYKIMFVSKQSYLKNKSEVDSAYKKFEDLVDSLKVK